MALVTNDLNVSKRDSLTRLALPENGIHGYDGLLHIFKGFPSFFVSLRSS
jgi:hypothetical protein